MISTTYYLPKLVAGKLADYAYWERQPASVVLTQLIVNLLKGKNVKPRPQTASSKETLENAGGL